MFEDLASANSWDRIPVPWPFLEVVFQTSVSGAKRPSGAALFWAFLVVVEIDVDGPAVLRQLAELAGHASSVLRE
jgi:hypothetical protein